LISVLNTDKIVNPIEKLILVRELAKGKKEANTSNKKIVKFYIFDREHYLLANVKDKPIPVIVFSKRATKKEMSENLWILRRDYLKVIKRDGQFFHLVNKEGIEHLKYELNYNIEIHDNRHKREEKKGEIVCVDNNYYFHGRLIFQDFVYLKILNWLTRIVIFKDKFFKLTIEGFKFIKTHYPNIKLLTNIELEKERNLSNFLIYENIFILDKRDLNGKTINYTNLAWFDLTHLYFKGLISIQFINTDIEIEERERMIKNKIKEEICNNKKDIEKKINEIVEIARMKLETRIIISFENVDCLKFIGNHYKNIRIKARARQLLDISDLIVNEEQEKENFDIFLQKITGKIEI
jgi:hypothetical protein